MKILGKNAIDNLIRNDEEILWESIEYISKKNQKIKKFYLLTDQRWMQSPTFPYGADEFVYSLINIDNDVVKIEIGLVQGVWISKKRKNKVFIGPYLNPYLIEYEYEVYPILGIKLLEEKSLELLKCFREIITLGDELRIGDYDIFYPRIE